MKTGVKVCIWIALSVFAVIFGISVGSVNVPISDVIAIFMNRIFSVPLPVDFSSINESLIYDIRFPRVILVFIVGGSLAISGTVFQSILQNPLASAYVLGVSAGSALGVTLLLISGVSSAILGAYLQPAVGLVFGIVSMIIVVGISQKIDRNLSNNSIVLTGMVMSLFINAMMTTISAAYPQHALRITMWLSGSFSLKDWDTIIALGLVLVLSFVIIYYYQREMDIMSLGGEQAVSTGINLKQLKWILILTTSFLTGVSVSFVGIIGFVDLISPHIVRKFFGARHKLVIPMSMLFGGSFLVLCDVLSRTLTAPSVIPISSITAMIGAPFFVAVYLRNKGR